MSKTIQSRSFVLSANSNNKVAIKPLQEGLNSIWSQFEQSLLKIDLHQQI